MRPRRATTTTLLPVVLFVAAGAGFSATFLGGTFTIDLPNQFAAGQPARAAEVNANFDTIVTAVENRAVDVDARLDDIANPDNLIVVSSEGGDFTSVADALASITDASDTNRYLVHVGPGVYDETQTSTVPSFVTLRGAGPNASVVRTSLGGNSAGAGSSAVVLETDGAIEDIAIENDGATQNSFAISGIDLSRETRIANVVARCDGTAGIGHTVISVTDSDVTVIDSVLTASGGTTVNTGFTSIDSGGIFAQPLLRGCEIDAEGASNGIGLFVGRTSATVVDCNVTGDFRAMSANQFGTSTIRHSRMATSSPNVPVYEQTSLAEIHSGFVQIFGANPQGASFRFRFRFCIDNNFNEFTGN
ncbi:MAG: hypothetical protein AAF957_20495 [Planctomycetota bacterium]